MLRCRKCLYPETTRPYITFNDEGVCSGCVTYGEKEKTNWSEREKKLKTLITGIKGQVENKTYDCIIPVSGGKDSHFQVHYVVKELGLKPLLVTFNHLDNCDVGLRNLENLIVKFELDHIRFTPSPGVVRKTSRHAFKLMGDPFWHEHAGIYTYPVQVAVEKKIPLIIWGEFGYMDLMGMFSHDDFIEMSKKLREEHGMRGYDPEAFIKDNEEGLTLRDIPWSIYPSDDEIEAIGVKGIYLSNYVDWNPMKQTELMIKLYDFETATKERTFNTYENVECYFNDTVHDYKKFFKFGYGRATDHASQLIRMGLISRSEGMKLIETYDVLEDHPKLGEYLDWIGISAKEWDEKMLEERDERATFFYPKEEHEQTHLFGIFRNNQGSTRKGRIFV